MKRIKTIFLSLLALSLTLTGCEKIFDSNSDAYISPDENQLQSSNDTIYSLVGIFSQLEKLADRYVLLGELRADLMDVTTTANPYLKEIYNHEISENNPYNKVEDYYAVINNCNYLINTIDTAKVINTSKVMYKHYAEIKTIRAWTYLQLALNYGKVKYYEQSILTIADASKYVEYSLKDLIPVLIRDLEPWESQQLPGGFSLGVDLNSSISSYFCIRFVLGDLYLWNGEYEKAATKYYDLIARYNIVVRDSYRSLWTVESNVFVTRDKQYTNWLNAFALNTYENITLIASSTENGKGALLDSLSWSTHPEIVPSAQSIANWNNQTYYHSTSAQIQGDLRGDLGSYIGPNSLNIYETKITPTTNLITKFTASTYTTAKATHIYRVALLYLRYAEAVNRAGKPNLAFAVLKNGLTPRNLAIDSIVPANEKYSQIVDGKGVFVHYVNFSDVIYDYNSGIHERGCGNAHLTYEYRIPQLTALQDSVEWVENKIIEECALETAFEGNRFHDLMRIAFRRNNPAFLADRVAQKYTDKEAIRTKLLNEDNWYLKK